MKSAIESLLYVATRPLSYKEIAKIVNQKVNATGNEAFRGRCGGACHVSAPGS